MQIFEDYIEIKFYEMKVGMRVRIKYLSSIHIYDGIVTSINSKEVIIICNSFPISARNNNNYSYYKIIERDYDLGI